MCEVGDPVEGAFVEIVVLLVVVLALVGGIMWNKRNAALALEGITFTVEAPPDAVVRTIHEAYCGGAMAMAKRLIGGVSVTETGGGTFRVDSRIGDRAVIEVQPRGAGSTVRAHTVELYVGSPPALLGKGGLWGLSAAIVHRINVAIGISPNAARMKRMQQGVQGRVLKGLRRSTQR